MRVLVALGGNALLEARRADDRRGPAGERAHRSAALAPVAAAHQLVLSHGNGPQVGLLALQASAYKDVEAYPLDVLGAQTEGMIGYLIEQELGNLLPAEVPLATLLTMIEVDADDPAFDDPTKFVGPIYDDAAAESLAERERLGVQARRRAPPPRRGVAGAEADLRDPADPVAARPGHGRDLRRGGGIPDPWVAGKERTLGGIEAVIDKDLASELLAREIDADLFVMATDVDGVYEHWGTPEQRKLDRITPEQVRSQQFAAGSMGPKVAAAAMFVEHTGKRAAIGALADIDRIVAGEAGTSVVPTADA